MKSKILILILALVMAVSALTSCTYVPSIEDGSLTLITVDAGVKMEFVVNANNSVIAATPLDDTAAILLSGETLSGMSPDKSVAEFVALAAKAKLIEGGLVQFSITGASDYTEVMTKLITKKSLKSMKKAGIEGRVEVVAPMNDAELRNLCLEKKYIYEEDSSNYTYNDLIYALAIRRVGYIDFPSEELIYLYEIFDETYYNSIVKGETLKDVETKKDAAPNTFVAYQAAVSAYTSLTADVKAFFVEYYFAEDSDYQITLAAMRDAREAMINGTGSKAAYENAEKAFNEAATIARNEVETYRKKLDIAYESIETVESTFIDQNELELHLRQTYKDRYARVKSALENVNKDFRAEFEAEIALVTKELAARKQNLIK